MVDEKGTHNVKFITENYTKKNKSIAYTRMGNGTESTYAYNRLAMISSTPYIGNGTESTYAYNRQHER